MSIRFDASGVIEHVAVALGRYQGHLALLVESWPSMELYASVSADMNEVRSLAFHLPTLSAPLCELIISHAELVSALLQGPGQALAGASLDEIRARHREVARRMLQRCSLLAATLEH